jgi:hypothetical protein
MNRTISTFHNRGLRVSGVLIAAGIALTACGSSSSGGAVDSSLSNPTTTPSSTSSAPPVSSGGGLSDASFCAFAKAQQANAAKEAKEFEGDTPQQLGAFVQKTLGQLQEFASSAPSAIKPDVAAAVVADQKVFAALKNANYDYRKLSPAALESVDTPAFRKASADIAAYLKDKCGITTPTS